jgi:hypothetical protein
MLTLKTIVHIAHREGVGSLHGHTLLVEVGFPDFVVVSEAAERLRHLRSLIDYAVILQKGDPFIEALSSNSPGATRICVIDVGPPTIGAIFGVLAREIPALDIRISEEGGPVYQWNIGFPQEQEKRDKVVTEHENAVVESLCGEPVEG